MTVCCEREACCGPYVMAPPLCCVLRRMEAGLGFVASIAGLCWLCEEALSLLAWASLTSQLSLFAHTRVVCHHTPHISTGLYWLCLMRSNAHPVRCVTPLHRMSSLPVLGCLNRKSRVLSSLGPYFPSMNLLIRSRHALIFC